MRSFRRLLPLALCLAWLLPARAQARARVMVVQSYHADYVWVQAINRGVEESLRGLNASIDFQYMDALRDPDAEHLHAKAKAILERIEAEKPEVVIAADDAAQEYLVAPFLKGRASPQVIFCGVNAPLATYGYPAANVSGVRERWHFREGFALLGRIKPGLRTVVLLTDDSRSSGYVLEDLHTEQRQGGRMPLKLLKVEQVRSWQQWQRAVLHWRTRADALALGIYFSLLDETTGKVVPAEKVVAWNTAEIHKPTLGFADYAKQGGLLCGILESGEEQGYLAGGMARNTLEHGVAAGTLPVRINQRGIVLLNLKAAERLGLVIPYEIIRAAGIVIQ